MRRASPSRSCSSWSESFLRTKGEHKICDTAATHASSPSASPNASSKASSAGPSVPTIETGTPNGLASQAATRGSPTICLPKAIASFCAFAQAARRPLPLARRTSSSARHQGNLEIPCHGIEPALRNTFQRRVILRPQSPLQSPRSAHPPPRSPIASPASAFRHRNSTASSRPPAPGSGNEAPNTETNQSRFSEGSMAMAVPFDPTGRSYGDQPHEQHLLLAPFMGEGRRGGSRLAHVIETKTEPFS